MTHLSDRKYRHRGYQDSGGGYSSNSSSSGGARPPQTPYQPQYQRIEGAPRGRTAGGFGPEVFKCNACGTQRIGLEQPTSEETCVKCGADLHTCGNCRAFDTTTLWECRENIPARVSGKQTKNACTFYEFRMTIEKDTAPTTVTVSPASPSRGFASIRPNDARKAFDDLFKK